MLRTPDYFEVLPNHPKPQKLESLTSYITRIAENNGISSRYGLSDLLSVNLINGGQPKILTDYPRPSFYSLPSIANCSEELLHSTTFYHLIKKFGRLLHSTATATFLSASISPHLRYCPKCLDKNNYYSLLWRFTGLMGCVDHSCYLMDHCGHCGKTIPLISPILKIGVCPICKGVLSHCSAQYLDEKEHHSLSTIKQDLEFLLLPHELEESNSISQEYSQYLGDLRQEKNLTGSQVARELGIAEHIIVAIEGRYTNGRGETLYHYAQYLTFLGITFQESFTGALSRNPKIRIIKREELLLENVQKAIQELQETNTPINWYSISKLAKASSTRLKRYSLIAQIIITAIEKDSADRENTLVKDVQTTIKKFQDEGKSVSPTAIARYLGFTVPVLLKNPNIKIIFEKAAETNEKQEFRQNEMQLIQEIENAVKELTLNHKSITKEAIIELVGIPHYKLRRYPKVIQLFTEIGIPFNQDKEGINKIDEQDLIVLVNAAINHLTSQPQRLTFQAIRLECRISRDTLIKHSKVKEIIDTAIAQHNKLLNEKIEQTLYIKVQEAINDLIKDNEPITHTKIGNRVGLHPQTLRNYPSVHLLLKSCTLSNHNSNKSMLMDQVGQAISQLEARGEPITYIRVAKVIGIAIEKLKYHPEIRNLLNEYADSYKNILKKRREDKEVYLLGIIKEAIEYLKANNLPISPIAISRHIGIQINTLKVYPSIKLLFSQLTNKNQ